MRSPAKSHLFQGNEVSQSNTYLDTALKYLVEPYLPKCVSWDICPMIYSLKNVLHGKHIMQPFYTLAYPRWEYCVYKLNPGFPKFICLLNSFAFQHLKAAISPGSVEYTSINGDTIWKNCFCSMISGAEAGILLFTARLPQRGVIVIPVTLSFLRLTSTLSMWAEKPTAYQQLEGVSEQHMLLLCQRNDQHFLLQNDLLQYNTGKSINDPRVWSGMKTKGPSLHLPIQQTLQGRHSY